jgi:hypothetical protein
MNDVNAPLTPCLRRELHSLETFYNPKPGDQGSIALLAQSHNAVEDEMFAYPYKESITDIDKNNDDVEFCSSYLPEYDSNPQSAAQALLSK